MNDACERQVTGNGGQDARHTAGKMPAVRPPTDSGANASGTYPPTDNGVDAAAYRNAGVPPAVSGASRPRYGHVTIRDRGRLPHWEYGGSVYFITFRLADSLPRALLEEIRAERERLRQLAEKRTRPLTARERKESAELFSVRIDHYLDSGTGACHLAELDVAAMLRDALTHFHEQRYRLFAWCIMPNHVHMLVKPLRSWSLARIMHSIKSYTAKQANRILKRSGVFWQREYYDRIVRDEKEFAAFLAYILENPVKAGLKDWPWMGSCREGLS